MLTLVMFTLTLIRTVSLLTGAFMGFIAAYEWDTRPLAWSAIGVAVYVISSTVFGLLYKRWTGYYL